VLALVILTVATALVFNFTNGFHDTANAMATTIATQAMSPRAAVALAAVLNLIGAFLSVAVAATIASGIVDQTKITVPVIFAGLVGQSEYNLRSVIQTAEAIASWQHFAILAVLELKNFIPSDRSISERLNIPLPIARECLERLERLELIKKERNSWSLTGRNMSTPDQVPSGSLREGHRQNILKALDSLAEDSVEIRDISGITMAVSSARLEGARKMIQEFRRRLAAYMEGGKRDAVYRLNIQLIPLSKEKK